MSRAVLAAFLIALAGTPSAAQVSGDGVLRGRVVTADTAGAGPLRVLVRWRAAGDPVPRVDSARVDSAGAYAVPLPTAVGDSLEIMVDAVDEERRAYHPALARIAASEVGQEQAFVLVPTAWTIPAGRYAGSRIPIRPSRARQQVCEGCSAFWITVSVGEGPPWWQVWAPTAFPLGMAFDRAYSRPAGAAPDSVEFWRIVDEVEALFGANLFRPARVETGPRNDPWDDVLVMIDPGLETAGLTSVLGRTGRVEFVSIRLRRSRIAGRENAELVAHELMHALGFGHTCAWRSVSADLQRCPVLRAPMPTEYDVAYMQVLYRVRAAQLASRARWGMEATLAAEAAAASAPVP